MKYRITPYGQKLLDTFIEKCRNYPSGDLIEKASNTLDPNACYHFDCIETVQDFVGWIIYLYDTGDTSKVNRYLYELTDICNESIVVVMGEFGKDITYIELKTELDKCFFSELDLLALLENMRISQKYDKDNTDYIIRLCESFLAEFMLYKDRHEWTSELCEKGLVHYGIVPNLKEAEEKYLELLSKLGVKTE